MDQIALDMLKRAYDAGPENGFISRATPELHHLWARGLVARNPMCSMHWRITRAGKNQWLKRRGKPEKSWAQK